MAEKLLDGGKFRAGGDCYGGSVRYQGLVLWSSAFPGIICGKCCGGNVELEIEAEEFNLDGTTVRAVQFGKLGKNDDIFWTQWFVKVPFVGWSWFGSSTYALKSQMPEFPLVEA